MKLMEVSWVWSWVSICKCTQWLAKEPGKQYIGSGLFGFDHNAYSKKTLYSLSVKPHPPLKTAIRNNTLND